MARPPLPLGTAGKIKTFPIAGRYRSRVRYRDYDGVARQMEKTAKTRGAAERLIAEAVRDRSRSDSAGEITPSTKMVTVVEAWWDGNRPKTDFTRYVASVPRPARSPDHPLAWQPTGSRIDRRSV
jgi:hypothetical protein